MPRNGAQSLRLLPLAITLAVSLFASGFWVVRSCGSIPPADFQRAGELIRSAWQPTDAIAVRPWWASRIRESVGDLPFVHVHDLEREDLSRHGRLWVVFLPGYRGALQGPFADGTYTPELTQAAGALTVVRYRLPPPARVLFDIRKELEHASVQIRSGATVLPCAKWVENRWMCTAQDWQYVGRVTYELGQDPREVIWAHPVDRDPLEVSFAEVPFGRSLRVHTGFTPPAARTQDGADVTLTVQVDDRELGQVVQDNRSGYFPRDFDLTPFGPGPHRLTFRITTPRAGMRHFCFDGEVRE